MLRGVKTVSTEAREGSQLNNTRMCSNLLICPGSKAVARKEVRRHRCRISDRTHQSRRMFVKLPMVLAEGRSTPCFHNRHPHLIRQAAKYLSPSWVFQNLRCWVVGKAWGGKNIEGLGFRPTGWHCKASRSQHPSGLWLLTFGCFSSLGHRPTACFFNDTLSVLGTSAFSSLTADFRLLVTEIGV